MAEPRFISTDPNQGVPHVTSTHSGICLQYVKRRQTISAWGWYDGLVGIEGFELSLGEFLTRLGITAKDCERALNEYHEIQQSQETKTG